MNMTQIDGSPIEILLVEDSPTDADLTMQALRKGRLENHVSHVKDGVEAMAFLRRENQYHDAPQPDVILLDLNMPRKDGREVLREIRSAPELKHLIVVVLTTSSQESDVLESYGMHANAYIVKPVDLIKFFDVVKDIDHFWFRVVTLPVSQ